MKKYIWLLPMVCFLAAPVTAQNKAAGVGNPVKSCKVGAFATYDFQISSPFRTEIGKLDIKLKSLSGEQYTVEETIRRGPAFTKLNTTYPAKATLLTQIKATYAKAFEKFTVKRSTVTDNIQVDVGADKITCKRIFIDFEAVNQGIRVKGDLYFDVKPGFGPLGIVTFRSLITYETSPGKFNLTQATTMRMMSYGPKNQ